MKLTKKQKKLLANLVYAEHIRAMEGVVNVNRKIELLTLWEILKKGA